MTSPSSCACGPRANEQPGRADGAGSEKQVLAPQAPRRAHNVPVLQDIPLARALVELEIGSAIPEALYEAVAEILREAWSSDDAAP